MRHGRDVVAVFLRSEAELEDLAVAVGLTFVRIGRKAQPFIGGLADGEISAPVSFDPGLDPEYAVLRFKDGRVSRSRITDFLSPASELIEDITSA